MRTTCVTLVLVLALGGAVAGCGSDSDGEAAGDEELTVALVEQNGSGQAGTATFTPLDGGGTRIVLELTDPPAEAQPAHVHSGSCDALGDPVVPLTNVVDGRSESETEMSLAELEAGGFVIHAHKSEAEYDVSVACAPVAREGEAVGY
jgi:hypothetical protein